MAADDNEANPGEPIKFNELIYRRQRLQAGSSLYLLHCVVSIFDKLLFATDAAHAIKRKENQDDCEPASPLSLS